MATKQSFREGSKVRFNVGRGTFLGKITCLEEGNEQVEVQGIEGAVEGKTYYRLLTKLSRA